MKLVFKKNEESQISVFQEIDGVETEFSYVDMIKELINKNEIGESEISNQFSDAEIKSIESMVALINKEIIVNKEPAAK